jgi:hypothetical protein
MTTTDNLVEVKFKINKPFRLWESSKGNYFLHQTDLSFSIKSILNVYYNEYKKPYTGFYSCTGWYDDITFYKNGKEIYSINKERKLSFLRKDESNMYYFLFLCDNFINLDSLSSDINGRVYNSWLTSNGILELPEEIKIENGIIENEFFHVSDKDFQIKIKKYINEL